MTLDEIIKWVQKEMVGRAAEVPQEIFQECIVSLMSRIYEDYKRRRERGLNHLSGPRGHIFDFDRLQLTTTAAERETEQKIITGEEKTTQEREIAVKYLGPLLQREIPPAPQVFGTWGLLMDYLQAPKNTGQILHTSIKKTLESFILDNDIYARYKTDHVSGAVTHRFKSFPNSESFFPMADRLQINTTLEHYALLIYCIVASLFNPISRKPASIQHQKQFFHNFSTVTRVTDGPTKMQIITKIISRYAGPRDQTFFSNNSWQSEELIKILNNENNTVLRKWNAILHYMVERRGDYLVHNGKKLFNCIIDVVDQHLAERPTQMLGRRPLM